MLIARGLELLADIIASYLVEMCHDIFEGGNCIYRSIYRDDGIAVFSSKRDAWWLEGWLREFEMRLCQLVGSKRLQFKASIWLVGGNPPDTAPDRSKTVNKNSFPFLDTNLHWHNDTLHFGVFKKPQKVTWYLHSSSTHK